MVVAILEKLVFILCLNSEEVSEDVRARMHAIQENEVAQLRDLTALLNLEFQFIESYLEILKGVKDEWVDECVFSFFRHFRYRDSQIPFEIVLSACDVGRLSDGSSRTSRSRYVNMFMPVRQSLLTDRCAPDLPSSVPRSSHSRNKSPRRMRMMPLTRAPCHRPKAPLRLEAKRHLERRRPPRASDLIVRRLLGV